VAVAEYENVFIHAVHGELGIVFHHLEIQCGEEFCAAQRTAGVSALNGMDHAHDVAADLGGYLFQVGHRSNFRKPTKKTPQPPVV
jgi:hypothetical protein